MSSSNIRVRFAPSPTGMMHLGNIRTALMNYLFAQKNNGTFILRIEDTDPERNFDPEAKTIIKNLQWLTIFYDEGPKKGGPYAPYFQSKRFNIYNKYLKKLIDENKAYRCFCSNDELEIKRNRQIAMKQPPRYDKTCLKLPSEKIKEKINNKLPFIWRIQIDSNTSITIKDIVHKNITFKLKHFSDFPLTRRNGSFTFMFANFVDDMIMNISHVIRGEDHLSNTAGQAFLYKCFNKKLPIFWHLPILCNISGKKLSKRDFGFSLHDLYNAGYLPEAIVNYLSIIGSSFKKEIMSIEELQDAINFDDSQAKGQIKYDVEKLRWINRKWISTYNIDKLTKLCIPYLEQKFPQIKNIKNTQLSHLIKSIQTDLVTVNDITDHLKFYFEIPTITKNDFNSFDKQNLQKIGLIIKKNINSIEQTDIFLTIIKKECKENNISIKTLFSLLRTALIGKSKGPSINILFSMLENEKIKNRLHLLIKNLEIN